MIIDLRASIEVISVHKVAKLSDIFRKKIKLNAIFKKGRRKIKCKREKRFSV